MASLVSENTKGTNEEENDIERHLALFKNLKKADKKIFGNIFCICLNKVIKDDIDKRYCSRALKNICGFLQLDNHDFVSMEPLLEQHSVISTKPFLTSLKVENVEAYTQHFIVSVLHFLFLLNEGYDARVRSAIFHLCKDAKLPAKYLHYYETKFCMTLLDDSKKKALPDDKSQIQEKKARLETEWSWKRGIMCGGAAVVGGAALVFTGGLAAPAVAAGFTALGSTAVVGGSAAALGSFLAGNALLVTSLFGVSGASLSAYKASRRMASLESFDLTKIQKIDPCEEEDKKLKRESKRLQPFDRSMALCICIQGWAVEYEFKLEKADQSNPTEVVDDGIVAKDSRQIAKVPLVPTSAKKKVALQLNSLLRYTNCETYNLTFEIDDLIALSRSIKNWVKTEIATYAGTVALQHTVLSALMSSFTWPAYLLKAADIVDNPWSIACDKADKAGEVLADILLDKKLVGKRPIKLIGYSLSGRTIYRCIEKLYEHGEAGRGIIHEVILIGCPLRNSTKVWQHMTSVVSGRIFNCYSEKDWLLSFLCRATLQSNNICGVGRACCKGIVNVDVDRFIHSKHSNYCKAYEKILNYLETPAVLSIDESIELNDVKRGIVSLNIRYDDITDPCRRITFFKRFQDDILSRKKTITIRDSSECYYQHGSVVEVFTLEEKEWFCQVKILAIERIMFADLGEVHAKSENMTLEELRETISKIYPGTEEFFIISYALTSTT